MRSRLLATVFRQAESLASEGGDRAASDAELVRRFAHGRNEEAFAALVSRHGPLVWGVCRNLLPDPDAEDAFQATFLALIRSAGKVRDPAALAGWLHGVAVRAATQAKREAARRRKREAVAAAPEAGPPPADPWDELQEAVHREIGRLPDRLRAVFVLCCLEGVRQPDAAARLGLKPNTVSGLVARARQRLLDRLTRRGLVPSLALAGTALGTAVTPAAVPASLVRSVLQLAHHGAAPAVLALARGAMEVPMFRSKLAAAAALVAGSLSVGVGAVWLSPAGAQHPPGKVPKATDPTAVDPQSGLPGGMPPGAGGYSNLSGGTPPGAGAGMFGGVSSAPRVAAWEYRFEDKPGEFKAFQKLLTDRGNEGWEYAGAESFAGAAGEGGPGGPGFGPGAGGMATVQKVVFKRQKAPATPRGGFARGGAGGPGMGSPDGAGFGGPGGRFGGGTGSPDGGPEGLPAARASSGGGRGGPGFPGGEGGFGGAPGGMGPGAVMGGPANPFGGGEPAVVSLELKTAAAEEVVAALSAVFDKAVKTGELRIVSYGTNKMLVRATPEMLRQIQAVLVEMDRPDAAPPPRAPKR